MIENDNELYKPQYNIKTASKMSGVGTNLIRAYENLGLLRPYRDPKSNYRLFTKDEIEWIKQIKHLINSVGLNIEGIKAFLTLEPCWKTRNCSDEDKSGCEAFKDINKPCWSIRNGVGCCEELKCHVCEHFVKARRHRKLQPLDEQNRIE